MKEVSIIGTVGVPANYGGFESLVENIIGYNSLDDIHYTVYCSAKSYPHRQSVYKNADLKYVPLDANGSQSILYFDKGYKEKRCGFDTGCLRVLLSSNIPFVF